MLFRSRLYSPYGICLGHNGNLTNARELTEVLVREDRRHLNTGSDSEVLLNVLASELQRRSTGRTVYVLDEPTTGLHFDDIRKLLGVLGRLVDGGNSVIVIEHNLDVIKTADWVIDLGPEGGPGGGQVIAQGTPDDVARVAASYTGQFIRKVL